MEAAPPLLPQATRDLAAFAAGLRFEAIPEAVIARVKLSLLDGIGVCFHGATVPWLPPQGAVGSAANHSA